MSEGSCSVGRQNTSTDRFCKFPVAFDNIAFEETKQSLLISRSFNFASKFLMNFDLIFVCV